MYVRCCSGRAVFIWTIVVGLLFGGVLLLAFWGMPKIIKGQLHKQTQLKEGTEQWDRFVELPFSIDFIIRFFHVVNPDDILMNNQKPQLSETKPYKYKLNIKKEHITFDDFDEDSVTYDRKLTFEFDESGETREDDPVTIVNPVLLAALQITNTVQRLALAGCTDQVLAPLDKMFITVTVRQLMFDGIFFAFENNTELGSACKIVRKKLIDIVSRIRVIEHIDNEDGHGYMKFSAFNYKTQDYSKDSNPDGIYTVNRGIKDISQLGNIMRWNGATQLDIWGTHNTKNNATCNRIAGTDSTIYRPQLQKNSDLEIFNTDICRSVKIAFKSDDVEYMGVKGYKYVTSPNTFRSSTLRPDDDCFCSKLTKDVKGKENCYLDGLFDFQPCLGAPLLISQPHFLNADAHYTEDVIGLSPDPDKHDIYLLLEPNTGTPLEGKKRIQLNSVMKKEKFISHLTPSTMYEAVVPVLWMEEGVSLPQKYVDQINNQYFKVIKITDGVKYALIAIFASLFAVCLFFMWRKEYLSRRTV